jgi:hypothetical protein
VTELRIASLARIADFGEVPYDVDVVDRSQWRTGDYVVGEVTGHVTELYQVEDCRGDMIPMQPGTLVIGAFGVRAATLEGVGSWKDIVDGEMHALTSAGLFGRFTSMSKILPGPMCLDYRGHVTRGGKKLRMRDFAMRGKSDGFSVPTILLVGTSMSAGKTMTGKLVCRLLARAGFRVIGAKLTGAARYRDILAFKQAGAFEIYDFVDVGLPSTVVPAIEFRRAIRPLLHHMGGRGADFLVVEAGASPLEPYNGESAIDELKPNIVCTILCASDPYAVLGVMEAFDVRPSLVTGPATNTTAAIDLVWKLAGVRAINIIDPAAEPEFRELLANKLKIDLDPG